MALTASQGWLAWMPWVPGEHSGPIHQKGTVIDVYLEGWSVANSGQQMGMGQAQMGMQGMGQPAMGCMAGMDGMGGQMMGGMGGMQGQMAGMGGQMGAMGGMQGMDAMGGQMGMGAMGQMGGMGMGMDPNMATGTVKSWNDEKGFGFIIPTLGSSQISPIQ